MRPAPTLSTSTAAQDHASELRRAAENYILVSTMKIGDSIVKHIDTMKLLNILNINKLYIQCKYLIQFLDEYTQFRKSEQEHS